MPSPSATLAPMAEHRFNNISISRFWRRPLTNEDRHESPVYNDDVLELAKKHTVYKILLIGDRESKPMQDISEKLNQVNNNRFIYNFSTQYLLEINNTNANKGKALEFVCQHLNIDLSEVLCLGDADNDVPMLKVAGVPVVMHNKNSKKYQEQYNIKHVQENKKNTGVGKFLNEYFNLNVPK